MVRRLVALAVLALAIAGGLLAVNPVAADQQCHPKCTPPPEASTPPAIAPGAPTAVPPPPTSGSPVPSLTTIAPSATPANDPVVVQQSETSIQAQPVSFTPHGDPNAGNFGQVAVIVMLISTLLAGGSFWLFLKLR